MDTAMTIQDFNVFLASQREESPMLKVLRQLMFTSKPEDLRLLSSKDKGGPSTQGRWGGWTY